MSQPQPHITADDNRSYRPEAFAESLNPVDELKPTRTWLINRSIDSLESGISRLVAVKHSVASHAAARAAEQAARVVDEQGAYSAMLNNHEQHRFMETMHQPAVSTAEGPVAAVNGAEDPTITVARARVEKALENTPQGLRAIDQDNLGATNEQLTTAA
jgi:hypothetical protein